MQPRKAYDDAKETLTAAMRSAPDAGGREAALSFAWFNPKTAPGGALFLFLSPDLSPCCNCPTMAKLEGELDGPFDPGGTLEKEILAIGAIPGDWRPIADPKNDAELPEILEACVQAQMAADRAYPGRYELVAALPISQEN